MHLNQSIITVGIGQKNRKLVRKHPRNQGVRKSGLQDVRHLHQKKIAFLKTETIVKQLEINDIEVAQKLPLFQILLCKGAERTILYGFCEGINLPLL